MKFLCRLNRPWLHFIVLGSLLFYLQGELFPEPKPGSSCKKRSERRLSSAPFLVASGASSRSGRALLEFGLAGPFAWFDGEPGQVGNEAAIVV